MSERRVPLGDGFRPALGAVFAGLLAALLAALLSTACRVGPDYEEPATTLPAEFGELADAGAELASTATADAPLAQWWRELGDATLDSLIERALLTNSDLRRAEARVREARAARGFAASELYPTVNATAGFTRTGFSENTVNTGPVAGATTNLFQAGFDASWELDLFGRVRRGVEAAEAEVDATVEDRRDVLVTLLAEVARVYVELRGAQRQTTIARSNLAAQQETLELTHTRSDAGLASELDVARAEAQVRTTAARLPTLESTARRSIHQLSVLLAREPGSLADELAPEAPIPAAPARVPVGLPSDLLRRRPDVRRAERELAAATARIGAATAEYFPRFSLGAVLGLEAAESGTLFDTASRSWSAGANAFLPVLDFGRIRSNVGVQSAREEQAAAVYESTVLVGLREVADALVSFSREQVRREELDAAVLANRRAVELSDQVYREGRTDFLAVLQAQRDLFVTEDALADSEQRVTAELVALYKALGGGWEIESPTDGGPQPGSPGERTFALDSAP